MHLLVLFLIIITLFPLAMGTEPKLLHQLGVPAVWIAGAVITYYGMDHLFRPALDNGTLCSVSGGKSVASHLGADSVYGTLVDQRGHGVLVVIFGSAFVWANCQRGLGTWWLYFGGQSAIIMLIGYRQQPDVVAKKWRGLAPLISPPMQLPVLIFATGAVGQFAMGLNGFPILALLLAGIAMLLLSPRW